MKKIIIYFFMTLSILSLFGCTNTQTTNNKTDAQKTAFILDTILATALYNNSNFSAGKDYINTKSTSSSNTSSTTSFSNGGTQTNTVTKTTTKTKSKGVGFGVGF